MGGLRRLQEGRPLLSERGSSCVSIQWVPRLCRLVDQGQHADEIGKRRCWAAGKKHSRDGWAQTTARGETTPEFVCVRKRGSSCLYIQWGAPLSQACQLKVTKGGRDWEAQVLGRRRRRERSCFEGLGPLKLHPRWGIKSRNEILAIRKEAQFRKMLSSYITGVIGDEGIMKEMNELVAKHDHMLAKKRWGLHQRWHKQVFQNINEQVENELKMLTSDQIKDKLRYFHYQYMHASNHRLLFLDVLDNTYYNPLESLKHSIKYNNNFCDPLKHDLDKAKYETFIKSETVSKDVKTKETLDASKWYYSMFRSTIWGHLNADEEDGSQVAVKDLQKWYSHDVLYNTEFADAKIWEEEFPRGKYIVPNQGKGWSFRSKKEGKGKVYGLECMTQPKLQLYYT